MATQWIRARQSGRANRLVPGAVEARAGSWHRIADPGTGTTVCGKRVAEGCTNAQRRSSAPPEGDTRCHVCAPAPAAGSRPLASAGGAS
jgi:hypothetical protein